MHPFDFKELVLAKHAQHVLLIHFPISSLIVGVVLDFWGQWTKQRLLTVAAYYNLFVAALTTVPASMTGVLAWRWALEEQRLKGLLLMHVVFACLSSVLIWTVWLVHRRTQGKQGASLPRYRLPIEALAVAMVAVTGHLGGFLSGVNGPG